MTALFFILVGIFIILLTGWIISIVKVTTTKESSWLNRMWIFTLAINIDSLIMQILRIVMKN